MKSPLSRILCTLAGIASVLGAPPALADDSEVFLSSTFTTGSGVRANVLFIVDTSGSMDSEVITYDPTQTYAGSCDANYVYWDTSNNSTPPNCTTTQKILVTANRCAASYAGMQANGWWYGRVAQIRSDGTAWTDLAAGVDSRKVECEPDTGVHGDAAANAVDGGSAKYARNGGGSASNRWGDSRSSNQVSWRDRSRAAFYSANYINWYRGGGSGTIKTRLQIVKEVARSLITDLDGVNLGLMRYSYNSTGNSDSVAQGGMVTYPISELTATTRQAMIDQINSWEPGGYTPLSETFYEAHQYLSGGAVTFGNSSRLYPDSGGSFPSVPGSRTGNSAGSNTYASPMLYSCQKTFIVYLTDGLPTNDESASAAIEALPNFATDGFVSVADGGGGASCPAEGPGGDASSEPADGRCMVNLAGYMFNHDMRSSVLGRQSVKTYVVGFGDDIAASKTYLDNIARAGGGRAYTQNDAAGLTAALEEIFADVAADADTTFVSPTVAVNAFNRTRTLNSLYVSVFAPKNRVHWPGNVKKYQLVEGEIRGRGTQPAVDPNTGFFADGTSDLFNDSGSPDGPKVDLGGAALQLPAWDARTVYTYAGVSDPTAFNVANTAITNSAIGLPADATAERRAEVIEYTLGRDAFDDDNDGNFTDTRKVMGDPMHSRPAVAIYGGTEASPTGAVFVTTNDGMLHALDMNSGTELWSFLPPEMMTRLTSLADDLVVPNRSYGIDGDVRIFKYDLDDDGVIEPGDKMYAVFGFGRGGSAYYALDITSRTAPRVLWRKTAADLPLLGQAWSAPIITRVNVNSSQQTDPQKFVVIFGAGYDTSQENYTYTTDGVGTGVYMLELESGNLLWSAGGSGSGANWRHSSMTNSIPADLTVLDLDGDSFADRMYFGDMGGRIWRMDIWHGQAPANLVSGGVFATLGAGHLTSPTAQDARRFYYAPDVSVVTPRGSAPYINIAIGSGYRGHPLDTVIRDRFYSLRDYQPFNRRTNTSYQSPWAPITDSALEDVTTDINTPVVDGDLGWKILLAESGTTWRGEKVLAESVTVNGVIFFPTFTPTGADPDNPCLAKTLNRTWAVYLDSAKPFGWTTGEVPEGEEGEDRNDPSDRYIADAQGGIAPGTSIVQTEGRTICLKGVATHKCADIGDVTRTFWERRQ